MTKRDDPTPSTLRIGARLKAARVLRDMSYRQVSELCGCVPQTVMNAEAGRASANMIIKIVDGLGLTIEITDPKERAIINATGRANRTR